VLPLKDENPTRTFPAVTILIIAACVVIYFFVQPTGQGEFLQRTADQQVREIRWTLEHAAIPCEVVNGRPLTVDEVNRTFGPAQDTTACEGAHPLGPPAFPHKNVWLAVLVSMFLHGSLLHIGGNMLFLWIFGNNIEDRMGKVPFLAFYLAGGAVAAAAHIVVQPASTVPVVGASGAIAAVMGAYLVLFPNAPIRTLVMFVFITYTVVPARWLLIIWFIMQFFTSPNSGVAWVAHVGGFVFGAAVAWALRDRLRPPPEWHWRY
jgi:membrane associated rhomboid family serine protease